MKLIDVQIDNGFQETAIFCEKCECLFVYHEVAYPLLQEHKQPDGYLTYTYVMPKYCPNCGRDAGKFSHENDFFLDTLIKDK